jgi:hypothetical protein
MSLLRHILLLQDLTAYGLLPQQGYRWCCRMLRSLLHSLVVH